MTGPGEAERAAAFVVQRVRVRRGSRFDQGARKGGEGARVPPDSPALALVARRRLCGVPEPAVAALLAWGQGNRAVDLCAEIPTARRILTCQARGRRCVSLVPDAVAAAHGDPRHPDGLSFVLHDLCHLEKFAAPEHHLGQVGFFHALERALDHPRFVALERGFDPAWQRDRDYVFADMNGSALFLFSVFKMKLAMAVRRQHERSGGGAGPDRPAKTRGVLDQEERALFDGALDTFIAALGLPPDLVGPAKVVSARRDDPVLARALLQHFERLGAARLRGVCPPAEPGSR